MRGNGVPSASWQQVQRPNGCRSSAAYAGELIKGDFASWVLHSPPLSAVPSEKSWEAAISSFSFFFFLKKKKKLHSFPFNKFPWPPFCYCMEGWMKQSCSELTPFRRASVTHVEGRTVCKFSWSSKGIISFHYDKVSLGCFFLLMAFTVLTQHHWVNATESKHTLCLPIP